MPDKETLEPETVAAGQLLEAFSALGSALSCISRGLSLIQIESREYQLLFENGVLCGRIWRGNDDHPPGLVESTKDIPVEVVQACKLLPEWVTALYEAHGDAMTALHVLSPQFQSLLDNQLGKVWGVSVRLRLLDRVITWPGETMHFSAWRSRKVPRLPQLLLECADECDPHREWEEYGRILDGYSSELLAVAEHLQGLGRRDCCPSLRASFEPSTESREEGAAQPRDGKRLPEWNDATRVLVTGSGEERTYSEQAKNCRAVLSEFQRLGWPPRIDDPIKFASQIDGPERVRSTCSSLNARLNTIRFRSGSGGKSFKWEVVDF